MAAIVAAIGVGLLCAGSLAADWPMARGDAARSGYTAEPLPEGLSLRWTVQEQHAPQPAWPHSERMPYDRAYQVVVAEGALYYGTSSNCKVVARDAATGKTRWTFIADAPVRLPPAIWRDRVLAAGDDGFLYCLDVADGRVLWKLRGGPGPDMLLGNDRMISRWPARGGPVVVDDTAYFGAGIWPSEGIFLYAVDVASGKKLWCNDSSGGIEMDQPHGGARARSGASAQGCLAAAGDALLVPTGRAVPAVFDRANGRFRYLHLQPNRALGGSEIVAFDGHFVNSATLFALSDGAFEQTLVKPPRGKAGHVVGDPATVVQIAVHPRWIVYAAKGQLAALDRRNLFVDKEILDRRGRKVKVKSLREPVWTAPAGLDSAGSLILAGDSAVVGGKERVSVFDVQSGQRKWTAAVRGTVHGLAAAGCRLFATTDQGTIYCFDGGRAPAATIRQEPRWPESQPGSAYAAAAEEIVDRSGVSEGYCLDLGCDTGLLALELARRTKLQIYAVDADPANVEAARRMLDAAGLYGVRVTVHQADPAKVAYPHYFADLVVSGRSVVEGAEVVPRGPLARVQRPYGGVARIGRPGAMRQTTRGLLAGAGDWTHQYADPANSLCSGDARLQGPLKMLWFRDTDLLMPSRHGRGPAPLVAHGRMFVEGLNAVRAVNLYNGSTLWEFAIPEVLEAYHQDHLTGVAATGSNLCLGDDGLFVHTGDRCFRLDAKTGRPTAAWSTPPRPDGTPGTWGFIACRDGLLFGTLANQQHLVKESWRSFLGKLDMTGLYSESDLLFALDAKTGKPRWTFAPEHSIRHNAIAIGAGRVYLIDRELAAGDTPRSAPARPQPAHAPGRLLCLDSRSGKVLWQAQDDVFGTLLALSEKHDVLLMSYQPTQFKLDSELGGRMAAYRASDGTRRWSIQAKHISRPVLNDRTIYAEPGKWDLLSGASLPFKFSRSYGCGILAGSSRLLVFRSATLGYFDLAGRQRTENYGGIRPGCWINAIPAGGLVLMGDAASWCTCSYLNQATIALQPGAAPGPPAAVPPGSAQE